MELKKDGIHTMTVCPGYVKTGFQDHVLAGEPPPGIANAKQFAITPAQCAESIVRGVERGARTVMAPSSGWLFVLAERLFPALVDAQLARMLARRMILKLKRTPGIYLVGFMGSGKSTVGRLLAERMGWHFRGSGCGDRSRARHEHSGSFRDARRSRIPAHRARGAAGAREEPSNADGRACWLWAAGPSRNRGITR